MRTFFILRKPIFRRESFLISTFCVITRNSESECWDVIVRSMNCQTSSKNVNLYQNFILITWSLKSTSHKMQAIFISVADRREPGAGTLTEWSVWSIAAATIRSIGIRDVGHQAHISAWVSFLTDELFKPSLEILLNNGSIAFYILAWHERIMCPNADVSKDSAKSFQRKSQKREKACYPFTGAG